MEKFTISRDESTYQAFADVVKTPSGVLICTYRECLAHSMCTGIEFHGFSRIVVRRSLDGGLHWGPRQVVCATEELWEDPGYNCSRLLACADGTVMLIVDRYPPIARDAYSYDELKLMREGLVCNIIFRSTDDGATWECLQETSITRGIVPSIKEMRNSDILVGVTAIVDGDQRVLVYRSEDKGLTWSEPALVPGDAGLCLSEGDFVELDDGTIVIYLREDSIGFTGYRSYSKDGGRSWSNAVRCFAMCCRGRPSAGLLSSGEVFVTYRFGLPIVTTPRALMMFVETQEMAAHGDDISDYDTSPDMRRFLMLDVDRALAADTGYSGWVELDNGDVLVVNYIVDDAPKAHIRGYIVSRRDWMLVPPGGMPWVGKGNIEMEKVSIEKSAELYRRHREGTR